MSTRFRLLVATAGVLAVTAAVLIPGGASGQSSTLPTLNIALSGVNGVSVSGSMVSGAVNVVTTFTGHAPSGPNSNGPTVALARLDPGVTFQQAVNAVNSHHGDINALDGLGALLMDAGAPGSIETVLTPGTWVALNVTGNGSPAGTTFTVTQSATPAALPAARATVSSIEFGFRGPSVLHDGTMVRAENQGYLVHMIILQGVRSRAAGLRLIAVLHRTSSFKAARPFLSQSFAGLLGPVSPGGMQQAILNVKPGYYVEVCFMDTQDGRQHTLLGMERLVRVVK
jgi:hypothetical protein